MLIADHAATLLAGTPDEFAKLCDTELVAVKGLIGEMRAATTPLEVLEKFDTATKRLGNMAARASLAKEVHPNVKFREVAETCAQSLSTYELSMTQDRGVYDALSKVDGASFDPMTTWWLAKTLREFRRSGVDRDDATRKKIADLNDELVKIDQTFSRNIRDDVRTLEFTTAELEGLPADWLAARPAVNGTIKVTTDAPDSVPVMTYAKATSTRERLWRESKNRGYPANVEVLKSLLAKRYELAQLLGYPTYAAYDTETKMAKSPEAVADFIERGRLATEKRAKADMQLLLERKKKDAPNADRVDPWEAFFLIDRVQNEQFNLDTQVLRQYFEYEHVRAGVMEITSTLFGIRYQPVTDAKTWSPEVETFDIYDGATLLGRIHLDMHPREGKYKHAAQFELTGGGGTSLPEAVLVCNFAAPGDLMLHAEVETFFHEFGHMLHSIFGARQRWYGVAGIKTEWDFVEAPSMMLQEWPLDAATLQQFAKHVKTNEPIPAKLVAQLVAAKQFGMGLYVRRQLSLASLALEYHRRAPGFDTTAVVKEIQSKFEPIQRDWAEGTHFELAFGHLGGYAASYYTYTWSQVIAKDLLTRFKASSMLDSKVAAEYRNKVLQPGGSRSAADSVTDFLGRPYSFDAFEHWLNDAAPAPGSAP